MSHCLFLIFELYAGWNIFVMAVSGREISYEDISKANFSCYPRDTCAEERTSEFGSIHPDDEFAWREYACRCDRPCSDQGTCCIDSPHRAATSRAVKPSCRRVDDTQDTYYVVDKCRVDGDFHPNCKKLCEREPESVGDLRMMAPVTSLNTSATYKNYYCLRCNERPNDFLFWKAKMTILYSSDAVEDGIPNTDVVYERRRWKGKGANGKRYRVKMGFEIPESTRPEDVRCDGNMISDCAQSWTDEDVRYLCGAYTAVVYTEQHVSNSRVYKNGHCALCNFESPEHLECNLFINIEGIIDEIHINGGGYFPKPFECFFRVDLERNKGRCGRNGPKIEWDDKAKKLRVLHCNVPGHVIKGGKCVGPQKASSG